MSTKQITPQAGSPTLQDTASVEAVFAALDAFLATTGFTAASAIVSMDGAGVTHSLTGNDRLGNSLTNGDRVAGSRVVITPGSVVLKPGEAVQFLAKAYDLSGIEIPGATFTWSLQTGALGALDAANRVYTAPAAIPVAASDIVTATMGGGMSWASVTVQLVP